MDVAGGGQAGAVEPEKASTEQVPSTVQSGESGATSTAERKAPEPPAKAQGGHNAETVPSTAEKPKTDAPAKADKKGWLGGVKSAMGSVFGGKKANKNKDEA